MGSSAVSLNAVLTTSLALIEQFLASIGQTTSSQTESTAQPSPLQLLSASATSLKSNVTKLSLLTINTPFTPSAISSILQQLNTSVLPSLVTATLLAASTAYPDAFSKECAALTRAALRDLQVLTSFVQTRSRDGAPQAEVQDSQKKIVTEATGKVWEDCDLLLRLAKEEVPGFVARKAKQWLELMKDAVQELQDWDPEEEDIDDQDFLGLDEARSDEEEINGEVHGKVKEVDTNRATISAGVKDQALRVLSRIPQSIHVVVKQRLEKYPSTLIATDAGQPMEPLTDRHRKIFDRILKKTRKISDCIDESAEAMYLGDPELCLKKAGEARALTIDVVGLVLEPWTEQQNETKEDGYIKKSLAWIQQVGTNLDSSSTPNA